MTPLLRLRSHTSYRCVHQFVRMHSKTYLFQNYLNCLTYLFIYLFFEQVLTSAVQCSLTEDSLLKISQQKPVGSVKPEAQCDEECDDNT